MRIFKLWILIALLTAACLYFADASYNPLVNNSSISYNVEVMDDFTAILTDGTTPTPAQLFSSGWRVQAGGTAAVSGSKTGGFSTIQTNAWRGNTGSTTTGEGCAWRMGYLTNGAGVGSARGVSVIQTRLLTPAELSSGTQRYFIGIGANNTAGCNITAVTDGSNSAWLFYNDLVNGGNWYGSVESAANTSNSQCDTGVVFEANTVYKACILFNSDSTLVSFFISKTMTDFDCQAGNITGTAQCTINTCNSIPNCNTGVAALEPYMGINKTVGTNAEELAVDYFYVFTSSDQAR